MVVGGTIGQRVTGARLAGTAALASLSFVLAACGDDTDSGRDAETTAGSDTTSSTASSAGPPPCDSVDDAVIFSIFGTVTEGAQDELDGWISAGEAPLPRPGAADLVRTYQDLGYDVLYVTSQAATLEINGQPLMEAVTVWLGANDFPIGEGTDIWAWDGERDPSISLIEDLALRSNTGVEIRAAYASDPEVVFPLSTSGIPDGHMFAVGEAASDDTVTSLPDADLAAHLPDVEGLDPICQ